MTYEELDTIVLTRDIPELALHRGDLGVIVLRHGPTTVEVEFTSAPGTAPTVTAIPMDAMRLARAGDVQRNSPRT